MKLKDSFNRIHDYVRISLIDKCNLNCIYCNPQNTMNMFYSNKSILSFEEIFRLILILVRDFEVKKIRFTGGEPLIRKDITDFFKLIFSLKNQYDFEIGITTNGTNLLDKLEHLFNYGIDSLNISLDTLDRKKFISITGKDYFDETLKAIQKAVTMGFNSVKINVVVIKGINDDELISFIEYFKSYNISLRFIEYMPFSGNRWEEEKFISWWEIKSNIKEKFNLIEIKNRSKISKDYLVDGTNLKVGFISSISDHFCDSCNRLRITASGQIKNCLFAVPDDKSLKSLLTDENISDEVIAKFILNSLNSKWYKHPDSNELLLLNKNNMMSIGG